MTLLFHVCVLSLAGFGYPQDIQYNANAVWPDTPCHCTDALAQRRHVMQLEQQIWALKAQMAALAGNPDTGSGS